MHLYQLLLQSFLFLLDLLCLLLQLGLHRVDAVVLLHLIGLNLQELLQISLLLGIDGQNFGLVVLHMLIHDHILSDLHVQSLLGRLKRLLSGLELLLADGGLLHVVQGLLSLEKLGVLVLEHVSHADDLSRQLGVRLFLIVQICL